MGYLVRGPEVIFNLAGQVSHIDSMTRPPYRPRDQLHAASYAILEAVPQRQPGRQNRLRGNAARYGKPLYLPVDEKHLLQPTDVNGINKIAGEWYHILYSNVYGIRATACA